MISSTAVASFTARPGARQLIKFCIVGASSFVIDLGLFTLLHFGLAWPVGAAKACSFLLAVCNGFYWNRRWTFHHARGGDARKQYPKFVLTNAIGLALNLSIMTGALILGERMGLMHTHREPLEIVALIVAGQGKRSFHPVALYAAIMVATFIVTAWNFTASKLWTFKEGSR
jgi:putative flippase GtrA